MINMRNAHTESPTIQLAAVNTYALQTERITERPKPYIPRQPPIAENIPCFRCGNPLTPIRQKDAGYLRPIAEAPGHEDGEDILGYACMDLDCLDGKYDE
jgi:hypothetical protein